MIKRTGFIIFVFLTGMILGATGPALLYGAETGGGNVWDKFVDPKPYPGTQLSGPLSLYFDIHPDNIALCDDGQPYATMYYTVRLNKDNDNHKNVTLYTFQGLNDYCLGDTFGQGTEIRNFLDTVVIPGIFPNGFKSWKVKSIDNAQFHDLSEYPYSRAFVADIEIAVKEIPKKGR